MKKLYALVALLALFGLQAAEKAPAYERSLILTSVKNNTDHELEFTGERGTAEGKTDTFFTEKIPPQTTTQINQPIKVSRNWIQMLRKKQPLYSLKTKTGKGSSFLESLTFQIDKDNQLFLFKTQRGPGAPFSNKLPIDNDDRFAVEIHKYDPRSGFWDATLTRVQK